MVRRDRLRVASWALRLALVAILVALGWAGYRAWQAVAEFPAPIGLLGLSARARAENADVRIGIMAGHWQNDSGAVCADGLREVDVTLEIATRLVELLGHLGYNAELLPEFAPELMGYQADALISIHADSCIQGFSGFKAAHAARSAIPAEEGRLVDCLYRAYEEATGLARDDTRITPDMTRYHAFGKIAPQTPAAILEIGYLSGDRRLLTKSPGRVARGIAAGIICFLNDQEVSE